VLDKSVQRRRALGVTLALALALPAGLAFSAPAHAAAPAWSASVIINEVYGGGGNSGGAYSQDFVELWNPTGTPVSLDGWSIQYASATGAWSATNTTPLAGTIPANGYYLIGEAFGANTALPALPATDATGTLAMSATGGKVALVRSTAALTCALAACAADAAISDLVGWGTTTTTFAGSGPAPATTNGTSVSRDANHTNTLDNAADFTAGVPTPSASGGTGGGTQPPVDGWSGGVIINEVYGGGGNSGGAWNQDFIELWNTTGAPVSLDGWSVQYASTTGAWSATNTTPLAGAIPAQGYFLIGEGFGADATQPALPAPDATGTLNMSGTGGKVALVRTATALTCTSTATCATDTSIADLVGWGAATTFAGSGPAPATTNATSVSRDANHTNTFDNAADFTVGAPTPTASGGTTPPIPPDVVTATIAEIQGTGPASPMVGMTVTTTGVVTAAYPTGGFAGYVIQTPGTGGVIDLTTHTASDALFVYSSSTVGSVRIGQTVSVTGAVSEFAGLTELTVTGAANLTILPDAAPVLPAVVTWPATDAQRETLESMLYTPGAFVVTDAYAANQYSEVGLASGTMPLIQPTDAARPGTPEAAAIAADNAARLVTLDDGSSLNFLTSANSGLTPPFVSQTDPVRVGAAVTFTRPVIIDYRNNLWKLEPTAQVTWDDQQGAGPFVTFEHTRTSAPEDVGGDILVASFNVMNYFTTTGDMWGGCSSYKDRAGNPITVNTCPGLGPRGAWDAANLARQQAKIVAAINALGADVVGLMEVENSLALGKAPDSALATLVDALNAAAGAGTWAYVPSSADLPPVAQMDAITTALIYKPAAVQRVGEARALGDQSGPGQAFANAREPIGQAFISVGGGQPVFVVVNHLKSKGSAGPWPGDADTGDGQGASNQSRVLQATALAAWVDTVTTPGEAVVLLGDFNSYTQEDPLQVLYAAGYVDADTTLSAGHQWSYSFDGLSGSLDHLFLNQAALARATGADIWEINAEESVALEYSRYNYHGTLFYAPDPYAASDHDPVVVGLTRGEVPPVVMAWDKNGTYVAGDRVTHLGVTWVAVSNPGGQEPGKGKAWVQVDVTTAPLWTLTGKYLAGDLVLHNGQIWQASRDPGGQEPGKGKFWILVG